MKIVVSEEKQFVLAIFFGTDSATKMRKVSPARLDRVANLIKQHPDAVLKLYGHTDRRAGRAYNMRLSKLRSVFVKRELIKRGVKPAQVKAYWVGYSFPVTKGRNGAERALNRRVNIYIIKKK